MHYVAGRIYGLGDQKADSMGYVGRLFRESEPRLVYGHLRELTTHRMHLTGLLRCIRLVCLMFGENTNSDIPCSRVVAERCGRGEVQHLSSRT